jgi:hypothetical protein
VEAEHDGYRRLPQGVIHRRRLLFIPPESWIVVDDFRGSGEHTFDFRYHIPTDADPQLPVFSSRPVKTERTAGWISRGYGEKKPCSTLRATFTGQVPAAAITFLLPDGVVQQLTLESGSGIACSYQHQGFEDIAVFSTGDSEITVADFRMLGEFFWLRLDGGVLKQVLAVRARSLDRGGHDIFRRSEPGPYFGVMDAAPKEKSLCVEFAGS